ncbi:MAG TPA: hypothetical protein VGE12_14570 [Noviherbaspirillum sp.]
MPAKKMPREMAAFNNFEYLSRTRFRTTKPQGGRDLIFLMHISAGQISADMPARALPVFSTGKNQCVTADSKPHAHDAYR